MQLNDAWNSRTPLCGWRHGTAATKTQWHKLATRWRNSPAGLFVNSEAGGVAFEWTFIEAHLIELMRPSFKTQCACLCHACTIHVQACSNVDLQNIHRILARMEKQRKSLSCLYTFKDWLVLIWWFWFWQNNFRCQWWNFWDNHITNLNCHKLNQCFYTEQFNWYGSCEWADDYCWSHP